MSVTIKKNEYDHREFKYITLGNQMGVLLVSDKDTLKSAAAMDVGIGNLQDYHETPGIAHFLEHMLFLGTERYPSQDAYSSYLSHHSGSSNAYTSDRNTNYYFEVANAGFRHALDMFAEFFKSPLFIEELTEREMKAVHSEYQKNINSGSRRYHQLKKSTAKQESPYNRFSTGSLETLSKPNIRETLLKFYNEFYSANLMKCVLYGNEDISTLEAWAVDLFSGVRTIDGLTRPDHTIDHMPFDKTNMSNFWEVVPVSDTNSLTFYWVIENMKPYYRSNPGSYITYLLRHQGPNSLVSLLKKEGLVQSLSSSLNNEMGLFSSIEIDVVLTKNGLERYLEVVNYVFAYLDMLKKVGPQQRIFDEIQQYQNLCWRFYDKATPADGASSLAHSLNEYPAEDAIYVNCIYEEYKPEQIKGVLDSLTLDNLRIFLYSKKFENRTTHEEKWYGTKYNMYPLSEAITSLYARPTLKNEGDLGLPPRNKFMPQDFSLIPHPTGADICCLPKYPQKIYEDNHAILYYKQDTTFFKPKAVVKLYIYSETVFTDALKQRALSMIWDHLLSDYLREFLAMVGMSDMSASISAEYQGLGISASGFNDAIATVLNELLIEMKQFEPKRDKFDLVIEDYIIRYQNTKKGQPHNQISRTFTSLMFSNTFLDEEYVEVLKTLTFDDILRYHRDWLTTTRIDSLITGNLDSETAKKMFLNLQQNIRSLRTSSRVLPKEECPEIRSVRLESGSHQIVEIPLSLSTEKNSCIMYYFQVGAAQNARDRVLLKLLVSYLDQPTYDQLRTTESLGYIVWTQRYNDNDVLGVAFTVQSSVQNPNYIATRIEDHIKSMQAKIAEISDEEFKDHVESLRVKIKQPDVSIEEETSRCWSEIKSHQFEFDWHDHQLAALDNVTKGDLIDLYNKAFIDSDNKCLEFHAIAQGHQGANKVAKAKRMEKNSRIQMAPSRQIFRNNSQLYPDNDRF